MTIQTRYRDVSAAELNTVHPAPPFEKSDPRIWEKLRGRSIVVDTTPVPSHLLYPAYRTCKSQWYSVVGTPHLVCTHLAEIGD